MVNALPYVGKEEMHQVGTELIFKSSRRG